METDIRILINQGYYVNKYMIMISEPYVGVLCKII